MPSDLGAHPRDLGYPTRAEAEIRDLTLALELQTADLRHQALHDGLTGLPNRVLLIERLESAIRGLGGRPTACALLLLDLDRFKEVNDTLGHQVGDVLLQQIGCRLQAAVLANDLVARLGGDEFAVLLTDTDAPRAAQVAEDLVRALQAPFLLDGQPLAVDASIGIALSPEHGRDADTLLRCADIAMYQAKRSGTGVAVYSRAEDQHRPDRLGLLSELRHAMECDELLLHYQPKLDLHDGTLVGVEALLRWQHPQHGFLPPSEFIPLAELSGLIHPLSLWVLGAALCQQQAWRARGMDIPVAVNLSRRMLHDPQLPETVAQLLAHWDVPPPALVLEITESSLMADPLRAAENLKQLRALGVLVSIDDFGTGYSSLASLKNLSVDELKIDQSFVRAMATDASSRAIVRAIIDLADALKLRVVAEGIEDRATWDVLARLGCDVAQGYFLSQPIAARELEVWAAQVGPSWLAIQAQPKLEDPLQERIRGRGARLTAEEEFIARKQAETALYASEARNRLALQAAGMATWEWDVARDLHTWSAETEALAGLAPGTFEATPAAFKRLVHADDWATFAQELDDARAEQRDSLVTYRMIQPDGSVRWIEGRGRGLYADDGSCISVTGTNLDITERKLAEEAVRTSEGRFRKQYKGFPLPTYSWRQTDDDDFVLQDYNDAAEAISGPDLPSRIGHRASVRLTENPALLTDLRRCVAEQRTLQRETRYRFPNTRQDRVVTLSFVFVPPLTVMVHSEDVTDVRQAEQQRDAMAQSVKLRALGQMATGIAHDLNQSLMLVSSYSDLARQALVQNPPDLAELESLLATSTQAALEGGETVKRLLLFTRVAPEHDSTPVDLSGMVRDAAQLTAPRWRDAAQADGRPITLDIETAGHPNIQGSPTRLRELMTNLIFNSVDALPMGGTIHLRVTVEDSQGVIEVADTGVGMTDEVQKRVFEPFFTTKGERGTGLGLAMVFGIVEQHAGRIEVHSVAGEGTSFRIAFPLVSPSAVGVAPATPAPAMDVPRPLRVLAVDDEPMITRAVVRMLRPFGHVVTMAASGEEALAQLADQPFDAVISDIGMGAGMNGWELAEAVRQRCPQVRFLLATGWGVAIDPAQARAKGVEHVLAKPYHPSDLIRALATSPERT